MKYEINKATIKEIDAVLKYLNQFMSLQLEGISLRPNGITKEEVIQKLPTTDDCTDKLCLVARSVHDIIGCLTFSRYSKIEYQHSGEFGMTILPEYWNMGIGKAFIGEMEKWCRTNKIRKIDLAVWSNNKTAIHLYEKFGFEIEGKRKHAILRNSKFHDLLLMSKWLGQPPC
jgi:RimJ/RimL family protein N-acetyltransferase